MWVSTFRGVPKPVDVRWMRLDAGRRTIGWRKLLPLSARTTRRVDVVRGYGGRWAWQLLTPQTSTGVVVTIHGGVGSTAAEAKRAADEWLTNVWPLVEPAERWAAALWGVGDDRWLWAVDAARAVVHDVEPPPWPGRRRQTGVDRLATVRMLVDQARGLAS